MFTSSLTITEWAYFYTVVMTSGVCKRFSIFGEKKVGRPEKESNLHKLGCEKAVG